MKKYQNLAYSDDFTLCYGPYNENIRMSLASFKLHENCTSIATNAFRNCRNLEKVYIENPSFKKIGEFAFEGCVSLKNVTILSNEKINIGQAAFYNTNIENLKISQFQYNHQEFDKNFKKTLKNLYLVAFEKLGEHFFMPDASDEFSNLESITVVRKGMDSEEIEYDDDTKAIEYTMKDFIYKKLYDIITLTAYPPAKKDKIVHIPENITNIAMYSFILNPYIEKIYIGSATKNITYNSFYKCNNLKDIIIESDDFSVVNKNIAEICPNLKNIYLTKKAYEKNREKIEYNPLYKIITLDVLLDEGKTFKQINELLKERNTEK